MMALEHGIARLVEEFIAAGRPSSRKQNIDDRRAGYVASAVLAGETETRVQVDDVMLEDAFSRGIAAECGRSATRRYLLSRRLFYQRQFRHPR